MYIFDINKYSELVKFQKNITIKQPFIIQPIQENLINALLTKTNDYLEILKNGYDKLTFQYSIKEIIFDFTTSSLLAKIIFKNKNDYPLTIKGDFFQTPNDVKSKVLINVLIISKNTITISATKKSGKIKLNSDVGGGITFDGILNKSINRLAKLQDVYDAQYSVLFGKHNNRFIITNDEINKIGSDDKDEITKTATSIQTKLDTLKKEKSDLVISNKKQIKALFGGKNFTNEVFYGEREKIILSLIREYVNGGKNTNALHITPNSLYIVPIENELGWKLLVCSFCLSKPNKNGNQDINSLPYTFLFHTFFEDVISRSKNKMEFISLKPYSLLMNGYSIFNAHPIIDKLCVL